jgi:hypothetical protein
VKIPCPSEFLEFYRVDMSEHSGAKNNRAK